MRRTASEVLRNLEMRIARLERQSNQDMIKYLNDEVDNLSQALKDGKNAKAKEHAQNIHGASEGIKKAFQGAMQAFANAYFGQTTIKITVRDGSKFSFARISKNVMDDVDKGEDLQNVMTQGIPALKKEIKNLKSNQTKALATFKDLMPFK